MGCKGHFTKPSDLKELFPATTWADLQRVGKRMDQVTADLSCESADESWPELDGLSFEAWLRDVKALPESRILLRNMCRGMIAQEPSAVSFLSIAKSMRGCWSGGDDDQYRLRGGTQAPVLVLHEQKKINVTLSSPVSHVQHVEHTGLFTVRSERVTLHARYVVVTGSPAPVSGMQFKPALDRFNAQLLQRMPMGTSMKFFVTYSSAWWRQRGLSGAIMSSRMPTDNVSSFTEGCYTCMDHSSFADTPGAGGGLGGALMCWIEGETNNLFLSRLNTSQQLQHVLRFLQVSLGNDPRALSPTSKMAFNWADEQHIRGAYTGYFAPGVQSQPPFWAAYASAEKLPNLPNLWLAGADWYTGLGNGYIEGAVRHGEQVAAQIQSREVARRATGLPHQGGNSIEPVYT